MGTLEIGQALVAMVGKGPEREAEFVEQHYANDVVSIEGGEVSEEMPARLEGLDAIKGKHEWWYANQDVHSITAEGPFVGHREDQFAVRFILDCTPTGGERMQMTEVALFTVRDDKVVQEEFLYLMG